MTNAKTTKRALLSSIVSLVLCFSMLLGTTFAWFTDSVTSANNIIKSGNLDIELEYWKGNDWVDVAGKSDILTNTLWEPGVTEVAYLRVKNAGSLALKYQLGVNIVSETPGINAQDETFELSDYIYYDVKEMTTFTPFANRADAMAIATETKLISDGYSKEGTLVAGADYVYLAMVVYMPTTVGNEANYKTSENPLQPDMYRPQIDLGINIVATQLTDEADDFDNQFDKDANLPVIESAVIPEDATESTILAPADTETALTVEVPTNADAGTYMLLVENKTVDTDEQGNTTVAMDIKLTKDGAKVTDNGTTVYTVALDVGIGKTIVKITHNGQEITDYDYNQDTGILEFTTASFSPFTFTFCDDPAYGKVAKVGDTYYATFAEAYNVAEAGDTITIVNNLPALKATLAKEITLDLGGNTVNEAALQVSSNVTIQNGKIKNITESYPIKVTGTLTMENVDLEASKSDRAIWLDSSRAVLNFNSGSVLATKGENNNSSKIYAIHVGTGATANINGGTITADAGPEATGVAIFGNYVNTVNVTGGKISSNGKNYSYGIWTEGAVNISGGEIVTNEKAYGYSSGITYGYNYAVYTKGDVTITGGKVTTNGFNGYLVYCVGSNQTVKISGVEFTNVLTEIDKTKGGHSAPVLVYGSANVEIAGGTFYGVSATLGKNNANVSVSGGTFDVAINNAQLAQGAVLTDNGDGTFTVA